MARGSVFVDHTTASATLARELSSAADARGLGWLDAPVSGGQAGAENGALTIMVGGKRDVYEQVAPVLECYARKHALLAAVDGVSLLELCYMALTIVQLRSLARQHRQPVAAFDASYGG